MRVWSCSKLISAKKDRPERGRCPTSWVRCAPVAPDAYRGAPQSAADSKVTPFLVSLRKGTDFMHTFFYFASDVSCVCRNDFSGIVLSFFWFMRGFV